MNMKKAILFIMCLLVIAAIGMGATNFVLSGKNTRMPLQGTLEDSDGNPMSLADLRVKVSATSSCTEKIIFDCDFPRAVKNGKFNVMLGVKCPLSLQFNKGYYMCMYVNGEQVGKPEYFLSNRGEIGTNDLADSLTIQKTLTVKNHLYVNGKAVVSNTIRAGGYIKTDGALYVPNNKIVLGKSEQPQKLYVFDSTGRRWRCGVTTSGEWKCY